MDVPAHTPDPQQARLPAELSEEGLRKLLAGLTAVRDGDLSARLPEAEGLLGEIAVIYNGMVDQLTLVTSEVTRVAREVGGQGLLGSHAQEPRVSGVWQELTTGVNTMADNLTSQVRSIAQVATAVARGDLTQKIRVEARGEILELKETINTMVDRLSSFAEEVSRVAREVGTDGKLGGQATVRGVSGTWKDLTDNVNSMATNLTNQVRNIAQVTTAVAGGDLTRKIDVDARGRSWNSRPRSTPWSTSCPPSPPKSRGWPVRSAAKGGWEARPRWKGFPVPGSGSPRTSTNWPAI